VTPHSEFSASSAAQLSHEQQQQHRQAGSAGGSWQRSPAALAKEQETAAADLLGEYAAVDHTGLLLQGIVEHQLLDGVDREDGSSQASGQQQKMSWVDCNGAAVMLLGDDADDGEEECGEAVQLAMLKGKSQRRLTPKSSTTGAADGELQTSATAGDMQQGWQQWKQQAPPHLELQRQNQHQHQHVMFADAVAASSALTSQSPAAAASLPTLAAAARTSSAPERALQSAAPAGRAYFRHTASGVGASLAAKAYTRQASASWSGTFTEHLRSAVSSVSSLLHPFSRSTGNAAHASCGQRCEQQELQRSEASAARRTTRRQTDRQLCGSVLVLDMGLHKLPGIAEAVQLVTVLPPVLEGRAHYFPPLNTLRQHTPGYLVRGCMAALLVDNHAHPGFFCCARIQCTCCSILHSTSRPC
jgi:hypothetical protein